MLLVTLMTGCGGRGPAKQVEQPAKVTSEAWGKLGTGQAVELYTLPKRNGRGGNHHDVRGARCDSQDARQGGQIRRTSVLVSRAE